MKAKENTISCQCGIYDTEYIIRDYSTKIVVTSPEIKWRNNSGTLNFTKTTICDAAGMGLIRDIINGDNGLLDSDGRLSLDDVLGGYR